MRKLLCKIGMHSYSFDFIPYTDQPFLNGRVENELCCVEGRHVYRCRCCGKTKKFNF